MSSQFEYAKLVARKTDGPLLGPATLLITGMSSNVPASGMPSASSLLSEGTFCFGVEVMLGETDS